MYPRFDASRCILCLHTITPIGIEDAGSLGYACRMREGASREVKETHEEREMWPGRIPSSGDAMGERNRVDLPLVEEITECVDNIGLTEL